ncbi:MAG TPA: hypothetical protein VG603_11810 [Chitinophagales bacterium]|nr:hypothetical protein [Chitinophagales bacterium]
MLALLLVLVKLTGVCTVALLVEVLNEAVTSCAPPTVNSTFQVT